MQFAFVSDSDSIFVLDDFNDGNLKDGNPVFWGWEAVGGSATFEASHSAFVITSTSPSTQAAHFWSQNGSDENLTLENTSVRAQLRLEGAANRVWVAAQAQYAAGSWIVGALEPNGSLYIQNWDPRLISRVQTDFRVAQEDVVLQLDVMGDEARLYAWLPSESMAETPQVTLKIPRTQTGVTGAGINAAERGTALRLRYLMFSSEPIREVPGTPTLGIQRDAILLSYPDQTWVLESRDTHDPFTLWKPETQPSFAVGSERRVGFTTEEAEGKEFRLTGPGTVPELVMNGRVILTSYPVYFDHWQLESHPTMNANDENGIWIPMETMIIGGERRSFVPAMKPAEFFRLRQP